MSESAKDNLLLVDGLSMAFRAFFALPVENFATSTGAPTNAVYGFTAMLATLLSDRKPTHAAVAFDLPGGTFRTERLPSYKGTRDETPPDFEPQVPLMREVLEALGRRRGRQAGLRGRRPARDVRAAWAARRGWRSSSCPETGTPFNSSPTT